MSSVSFINKNQNAVFDSADIAEAKLLPEPPVPEINRMEFDMKDQLVRQTIMTTQEDVIEIKEDLKNIERKIDELK